MLVAAAVCPHPPILVPEVAAGAASETATLRAACLDAVRRLQACRPDLLVVVGDADRTGPRAGGEGGSFAGFGVPVGVTLGDGPTEGDRTAQLPLSLCVGAWLLRAAETAGVHRGYGIASSTTSTEAAAVGVSLARQADRVALLVMGDGSARRTDKAPGALHPRAADFDGAVAEALATADCERLLDLDPGYAVELLAAGRAAWQVLAGAGWGVLWQAELTFDAAPYGVGYFVATWQRG
ncbi:MAG TPA: class III extradiol dioxygenase subunit B-like domain-containing protein [Mycobacteriales bacterium]|nr:class III extradiol dioxygenase subunit B-like domain-containing protein [Mycobacteriales bacterium]